MPHCRRAILLQQGLIPTPLCLHPYTRLICGLLLPPPVCAQAVTAWHGFKAFACVSDLQGLLHYALHRSFDQAVGIRMATAPRAARHERSQGSAAPQTDVTEKGPRCSGCHPRPVIPHVTSASRRTTACQKEKFSAWNPMPTSVVWLCRIAVRPQVLASYFILLPLREDVALTLGACVRVRRVQWSQYFLICCLPYTAAQPVALHELLPST